MCKLLARKQNGLRNDIQALLPLLWDVHLVEVKYRDDT